MAALRANPQRPATGFVGGFWPAVAASWKTGPLEEFSWRNLRTTVRMCVCGKHIAHTNGQSKSIARHFAPRLRSAPADHDAQSSIDLSGRQEVGSVRGASWFVCATACARVRSTFGNHLTSADGAHCASCKRVQRALCPAVWLVLTHHLEREFGRRSRISASIGYACRRSE